MLLQVLFAVIASIWGALMQLIIEQYPDLLVILGISAIVYFFTSRWERFYGRFRFTEEQSNKIENVYLPDIRNTFASIDRRFIDMDRKLTSLITTVHSLLIVVERISTFLVTKFDLDASMFNSKSPIQLTPVGIEVLEKSGGKEYVDQWFQELAKLLEKKAPKSKLDVENGTYLVLLEKSNDDAFVPIKDFIFQNPAFRVNNVTVTVDLGLVIQAMSIYMRDKYFLRVSKDE